MSDSMFIRFRKSVRLQGGVDCVLFATRGGQVYPTNITTWDKPAEGATIPDQLSFSQEAAQQVIDDLWDAGIRPTRKPEPPALLAAKEKHIDHLYELARLSAGRRG